MNIITITNTAGLALIALLISIYSLVISKKSLKLNEQNKHNNLIEKRQEFYEMVKHAVYLQIEGECEDYVSNDDLYYGNWKPIPNLDQLAEQAYLLFGKPMKDFFISLKTRKITQEEFENLDLDTEINFFYKEFKKWITYK